MPCKEQHKIMYKISTKKPLSMYPGTKIRGCICLFALSVLFAVCGLVLILTWEAIYEAILTNSMVLKPNNTAFEMWKINPVPLALTIYMFNWTNAEEVNNSSVKPRFEQIGPYVFTETKEKVDIVWNLNKTVTFKHLKKWYFDQSRSNGTLYDSVVSINPVVLSAAYTARDWSYWLKKGLNIMLAATVHGVATKHAVGQVLFDGYEESMLTVSNSLPSFSVETGPGFDKFGWFYKRNGSADYEGIFNMDTGEAGPFGVLHQWKHSNHTDYYTGQCNSVSGSAGEFFPRNIQKDSIIRMFTADLCRYSELEFEKEEVVNGILGYKFIAADRFLDNGTKVSDNSCFCDGDCMPSGALNVSSCRYGSPAFVSLPHFYRADDYYNQQIDGLNPQKDVHEFYITLEPNTGFPLSVSARLQLNLLVQPIKDVSFFKTVPKAYFPILWFEQTVVIPDDMAFSLKLLLNFQTICTSVGIILIWIGLLIVTCLCYKICTAKIIMSPEPIIISREEVPLKSKSYDM